MTKRGKGGKAAAVIAACMLAASAAVGGAVLFQRQSGHKKMVMAEEALSAGDPEKAAQYLEEVPAKSKYYPQAQSLLNDINTEKRYKAFSSKSVFDMKDGGAKYSVPSSAEIYAQARTNIEVYIQKLVDAGEYAQALAVIKKIGPQLKGAETEKIEQMIYSKRDSLYEQGNKQLAQGDTEAALASLESAEAIDPEYTDETRLRERITKAAAGE